MTEARTYDYEGFDPEPSWCHQCQKDTKRFRKRRGLVVDYGCAACGFISMEGTLPSIDLARFFAHEPKPKRQARRV